MQVRLASSFAVMSLLIMAWAGAAFAQPTRAITGVVVSSEGAAVANATVQARGTPTATGLSAADGSVSLPRAPVGEFVLEVRAEGYAPLDLQMKAGRTPAVFAATLVKILPPPPPPTRSVSGLVRDSVSGKPVAGAVVKVQGTELSAQTDADGYFSLAGVALADVVMEIGAADYGTAAVTLAAQDVTVKVGLVTLAPPAPEAPQTRAVRGKLTDANGEPVIGAVITVVGSSLSALSDENGAFQLDGLPLTEVTLQVAAESYQEKNVLVLPTVADVTAVLQETVAGEQIFVEGRAPAILKSHSASSSSVVKAQDLTRVTAQTMESALAGKIAGSNIQSNSGAPGGGAQIRLRGISTINGQSSPLYIVDGIIVSNSAISSGVNAITAAAAGGNASVQDNPVNRIADLNVNDIENVEVLKGASAAALYGSKAANGVIIITTKRGKPGKPRVSLVVRAGLPQVSNKLGSRTFKNADEVADVLGQEAAELFSTKTYDHEDAITQSKLATEVVADLSGGSDSTTYAASLLARQEPGIIIGSFYDKQSARLALSYDLGKRARINLTSNVVHSRSDRSLTNNDNTSTSLYVALAGTPNFIKLAPTGGVYPDNPLSKSNPVETVNLFKNEEEVWRYIGGLDTTINVLTSKQNAVSVQGVLGIDAFQQEQDVFAPPGLQFEEGAETFGRSLQGATSSLNTNLSLSGSWRHTPASRKFRTALTAGVNYDVSDRSTVLLTGTTQTAGQEPVDSSVSVVAQETLVLTKDLGFFTQGEIALLDDKLVLLAGGTAERSSLNGDSERIHFYPKLHAQYALTDLVAKHFDSLVVRGAFGQSGNRPNFGQPFTPLATNAISGIGTVTVIGVVGDPDIEPERQSEFELGTDLVLKDQRAVVELSLYQRTISNMLLNKPLATSTGFATQFINGGSFRNRGVEASVQVRPLSGPLEWISRATLTLNRTEVLDLPEDRAFNDVSTGFGAGLGVIRIQKGESLTQIVSNIDGDPELEKIGDVEPDFRIGFSNNFTYKNLGLSTLIDWQQGSDIINLTRFLYDGSGLSPDYCDPRCTGFGDAATRDATGAGEKRVETFSELRDIRPYIEDATFVKLREVSLFYDLPANLLAKLGRVSSLRVSLSGRNLLTFTNYSGIDPEVSNFGNQALGRNFDVAPYPPSRSYWLSAEASF